MMKFSGGISSHSGRSMCGFQTSRSLLAVLVVGEGLAALRA
jgi:hypothetical protein